MSLLLYFLLANCSCMATVVEFNLVFLGIYLRFQNGQHCLNLTVLKGSIF